MWSLYFFLRVKGLAGVFLNPLARNEIAEVPVPCSDSLQRLLVSRCSLLGFHLVNDGPRQSLSQLSLSFLGFMKLPQTCHALFVVLFRPCSFGGELGFGVVPYLSQHLERTSQPLVLLSERAFLGDKLDVAKKPPI